jgi:hypothetical protein
MRVFIFRGRRHEHSIVAIGALTSIMQYIAACNRNQTELGMREKCCGAKCESRHTRIRSWDEDEYRFVFINDVNHEWNLRNDQKTNFSLNAGVPKMCRRKPR